MVAPSPFLLSLARKRAASQDLQQGLGAGMDTAMGGLASLQKALEATALKEKQAEQTAYERIGTDAERARAAAKGLRDAEAHRQSMLAKAAGGALHGARTAPVEDDAPSPFSVAAVVGADRAAEESEPGFAADEATNTDRTRGALDRVKAIVGADEAAEDEEREDVVNSALGRVTRDLEKTAIAQPAAPAKARPPAAPRVDPIKAAKQREAEARATIAERKAADGANPPAPKVDAADKKHLQDVRESRGAVKRLITDVTATGTGAGTAAQRLGGMLPVVGERIDPGAKARTLYNNIEAFKKKELARLSGAGVSDREKAAFEKFNASIGDTTETALAALNAYRIALDEAERIRLALIRDPLADPFATPAGDQPMNDEKRRARIEELKAEKAAAGAR